MSAGVFYTIVKKAFPGNQGILRGRPKIIVTAGAPTGTPATVGTLAWDKTNSHAYICSVATGTYIKLHP